MSDNGRSVLTKPPPSDLAPSPPSPQTQRFVKPRQNVLLPLDRFNIRVYTRDMVKKDCGLSADVTSYLERYGLHPVTKWAKTYQKRVWFAYFSIEKAVPRRDKMFGRSKKLRAKDRK